MQPLILASQSSARKAALEKLGWPFETVVSTVDEDAHPEADPVKRAQELSRLKAEDVASRHPGRFVIACDTVVVSPTGVLLEKPVDADDARRMIRAQSGGVSIVHSALCVALPDGSLREETSSSRVRFLPLSEEQVEWWIRSGLWKGCSGAFQIEGRGQLVIEGLDGDWSTVMGLPVHLLGRILHEAGWVWTAA